MKNLQRVNLLFVIAAIIFSGMCWYLSNGLNGEYWWLLWLAPVPVMIIAFNTTARLACMVSFLAYLIGRLSWFSYLVTVATIIPAVIFTLTLPFIFVLIMMITRKTVTKINAWYTVFAYPVFFTCFEFLLIKFSPDGTAASIAYSQSNVLPVIQVAAITGILGITFLVCLIPSAIAVGWYHRKEKNKLTPIMIVTSILVMAVFIFGFIRIGNNAEKNTIPVGLVVLDEKFHIISDQPDFQKDLHVVELYTQEIRKLSSQGVQLVLLPERAINIGKASDTAEIDLLRNAAKQYHVFIVAGYTNFKEPEERNSALVIDNEGNTITDYNKVHLVKGLENQFTPGSEIGLFDFNKGRAGVAICKDLDFPGYISRYGRQKAGVVFIPAWDFTKDDWLHCRMAVLRGVENGFSEVRTARLGRLTISDFYGRVTAEASSANGNKASLHGNVSLDRRNTFYNRFGDWFGIINLIAAICFVFLMVTNKRRPNKIQPGLCTICFSTH